jgi:hypothetical protein
MSLNRLIYYSAIIGGWAALVACLISEFVVKRPGWLGGGGLEEAVAAALVGAAVGAGLNLVAGAANTQWRQQLKRLGPGLLLGGVGGAVGSLIGLFLYRNGLPRAIGWCVMGMGIGAVDGLSDWSWKKLRNGLIGGALGGLLGGFLFDPIKDLAASRTGLASRAIAFTLLGACIGALIGLVQVALKEAWLTVLDGYRPGRQLILSKDVTMLGRAEHAALPFFGPLARDVEREHARILRQPGGRFVIEDGQTKAGTRVNGEPIVGQRLLRDGDLIRLGPNIIRFSERHRSASEPAAAPAPAPRPTAAPAPRPVAVPPRPQPAPAPAAAPAAAPPVTARDPDSCPKCGRKMPGPIGKRRCLFDGTMF